jgi:hypothetical protein
MFGLGKKKKEQDVTAKFHAAIAGLVALQLWPKYATPREAFPAFMTSREARGYLFGMHDSLLQEWGLVSADNPETDVALIAASYKFIFGDSAGFALMSMSLNDIRDAEFHEARLDGGAELVRYVKDKTPPLGLARLLVIGGG